MPQIDIVAPAPALPPGQSEQGAAGGWAPYVASDQQAPQSPQQQASNDASGGWAQYTPQPPTAAREIGGGEAAMRGALDAFSFGAYPAMAGAASGIKSVMEGGDYSPAYNQTRQEEQDQQKQASEQHPYITGAAEIAGSLPMMMVPGLGAEAFGAKAASMAGRLGRSAGSGAVAGGLFGAGQQVSEGGSAGDVATGAAGGAAAGGVLGGALGGAIETGSAIGNRVMGIVRGARDTDSEAGSRVVSALNKDRAQVGKAITDKQALQAGQEAGTPLTVADLGGENTKALLRSAANNSPGARQIINDTVQNRYSQQADRFATWIRSKFGGMDKDADIDAIKQLARKENGPAYRKAYYEGDRSIESDELNRLVSAPYIQRALVSAMSKWKNYAVRDGFGAMNPPFRIENGVILRTGGGGTKGVFPNIQLWDYAARELQDRARKAPPGSESAKLYNDLARLLKNELDQQVPSYKIAREGAATFFKAASAEEAGANFVKDTTLHNAQAARIIAKMKPAERELFQRGFAAELAHQLERTGYRSDVLRNLFIASPRASQRIKIALGQDGADQFEALMRIEGLIDRTRQALGNSTTVRQAHEAGLAAAGTAGVLEGVHSALNPVYIIAGGLVLGGRAAAKNIDDKLAVRIAEMLMSDNPAELQRGYKIISANPTIRTALRRASDVTGRQIVNYLGPAGVAAAGMTAATKLGFGGAAKDAHQGQPNVNSSYDRAYDDSAGVAGSH